MTLEKRFARILYPLLIIVTICFAHPSGALAQDMPAELFAKPDGYDSVIRRATALVDSMMTDQNIPGVQIAVSVGGKIVWSDGFGWADIENGVRIWPHTKMRIGSVSKTVTSAAVGLLVDAGHLDLSQPVQAYVPYFPEKRYPITVRQVATHQAGIRHYEGSEYASTDFYPTVRESMDIFMNDSLLFEPGTRYSYSSYGWNLMSAVIEGASGRQFLEFMRYEILDPLGLFNTVADNKFALITHRAHFYDLSDQGSVINSLAVDNSYKWAGGGYLSTAEDLATFGNAIMDRDFLSSETVSELWVSVATIDGEQTNYGIGWRSGESPEGYYWVGHGGSSMGARSQFLVFPAQHLVFAMNVNSGPADFGNIHLRIAELFIEADETD